MAADLQAVLDAVTRVDAKVDEAIARVGTPTPPADLTPAVDAVDALGAKVDTIAPAAPAA